jgi:excisionase family DNA binding protein
MRSLEQVSRLTGVSVAHLRREVRLGKLVAHRFGRLVRIAEPDLRAYLASRRRVRR